MLADPDCNITYLNESLRQLMTENLEKFRQLREDFDVNNLVGTNIDVFHKNPSHQRNLLAQLTTTYVAEINLEGLILRLTANPVLDKQGNRLGSTLEWEDITPQTRTNQSDNARIKTALDSATTTSCSPTATTTSCT